MQICSILHFSWSILVKFCVHLAMSSRKTHMLLENTGIHILFFSESSAGQVSLMAYFFIQQQHMTNIANSFKPLVVSLSVLQNVNHIICKNWSNFQRKVGSKFTWNSLQMSLAAGLIEIKTRENPRSVTAFIEGSDLRYSCCAVFPLRPSCSTGRFFSPLVFQTPYSSESF